MMKAQIVNRLKNKTAKIGVVGLGYVGLPLILRYVEVGYNVIGFDIDQRKIEMLRLGNSYIKHISEQSIKNMLSTNLFTGTSDFSKAAEADALIICVPTPLNIYREPDLSYVIDTIESLIPYLRPGQIISLESTTYPGTTEEIVLSRVRSTGLQVGTEIFIVYSPEREDPGNQKFTTATTPKVCSGITENCKSVALALYAPIINELVPVSNTKTAELTKLLENIHRAVNIGLVNEMKIVADAMGIDIYEVINAASTKPFGFTPYFPGPGLGGHCIPIDPFYLTWKARGYGLNTRFIELAGEINSSMPDWVVSKVGDALNSKKKAINCSKILVIGIAYKKNVDDMRESPSVILMEKLVTKGAIIDYYDPYIPVFPRLRDHYFNLESIDFSAKVVKEYDCVLIATDHDSVNYQLLLEHANLIVDARGVYKQEYAHVFRA